MDYECNLFEFGSRTRKSFDMVVLSPIWNQEPPKEKLETAPRYNHLVSIPGIRENFNNLFCSNTESTEKWGERNTPWGVSTTIIYLSRIENMKYKIGEHFSLQQRKIFVYFFLTMIALRGELKIFQSKPHREIKLRRFFSPSKDVTIITIRKRSSRLRLSH